VDVLPAFTERGEGPRAPVTGFFGFFVGQTRLDEAQATLSRLGLACEDTSIRALMRQHRQQKQRELDERRARGEPTDAVSGASAVGRCSPKESNPQVRLTCEGVPSETLVDRRRPVSRGRLLLVFDSQRHPLRHVSFERTFPDHAASTAISDLYQARDAMQALLGETAAPLDVAALAWLKPNQTEWRFSDLRVRVSAIHYGARGIVVSELAEVPWPVRADAPALP
jgi:hypothetical protein